ncbi:hypothetical protein ACQEVF_52765 [Nonomuraea polychroma]|uniref:hypothetical protein n=1 Tax=Nonomuraea polychroma TaxID=46176 RepID=UPI003D8D8CC4
MRSPRYAAGLNSTTAMVRATGNVPSGRGFPPLGLMLDAPTVAATLPPAPLHRAGHALAGGLRPYRHALDAFEAGHYPLPESLSHLHLDVFLDERGDRYLVRWKELATRLEV